MKWIRNRNEFLNEAKLRDVLLDRQAKKVASKWGEKYLDYEEVEPTKNINQGKWKLSESDKNEVLGKFFDCKMDNVFKVFETLPEKFIQVFNDSIDISLITNDRREKYEILLSNFTIEKPTIDQMSIIFDNVFRALSINETKSTEMIQKDENGRPVRDEEGNMIKIKKEEGDPVYTKNLTNINSFISGYNSCYEDKVDPQHFQDNDLIRLRNMSEQDYNEYKSDFDIFNKDLYLSINHNPVDILNMSISKFYTSCQHLYDGGYSSQLLSNVFDPNSIPAYLIFDTPIFWDDEKISNILPLSRMIIRNIETFDDSDEIKIFFDRAYPDRMKDIIGDMITKYSDNRETESNPDIYYYMPDVDVNDDNMSKPYMDRLDIKKIPYIGVNTKSLYLSRTGDWSKFKISPNARLKEIVIETTEIPDNLLDINIQLDWIKFKFLDISDISVFNKIKSESIAFDKCKFDNKMLNDLSNINKDIKRLQIISCDSNNLDLSSFDKLEELQLIYTLDSMDELKESISKLKLNKLVISGDLLRNKEDKEYINSLKSSIKIEIVGPVI